MTTITIHIDKKENAELLEKMLRELSFIEEIEVSNDENMVNEPKGSYLKLKRSLDQIDKNYAFKNVDNPSKWQQDLRDEW